MHITREQLEQAKGGQAVELAENGDEFVLIRKDVYQRVTLLKVYSIAQLGIER